MNRRIVSALQRAGFEIEVDAPSNDNPRYQVSFARQADPLVCFSKVYDQRPNPQKDFIAVMVCDRAAEQCPVVSGARQRLAITYEDPKVADNTAAEADKYDERCRQIAREMLFVFAQVAKG